MTTLIKTITEWRQYRATSQQQIIGFVPTMGYLHAGHASLIERSKAENDVTVLSIFVNPSQFNNRDDLQHYPRDQKSDLSLAQSLGVDSVFMPSADEMYPDDYRYQINETHFSQLMEGEYRPGHFSGVLTVVCKLLMLIKPHRLYLGEKDYQQLQLIKGMINAFFLETEIIACPIIRENDGLAMSSRNARLTPEQRAIANQLHEMLQTGNDCDRIKQFLLEKGFNVDYVQEYAGRRFGAASLGDVRLIDNIEV